MKRTLMIATLAVGTAVSGTALANEQPYCREYQRTVTIGGKAQQTYGTACMQPDGSWRVATPESDFVEMPYDAPLQVAAVEPTPVVYTQPVYTSYYEEPSYRYYAGPSWGVNLGWSDRGHGRLDHGHRGHGGGHGWR